MTNMTEPLSSFSVSSSSHLSNGTSKSNVSFTSGPEPAAGSCLEVVSLSRLSSNLEKLLIDSEYDCSDAVIVVEGIPVGVHRCILSARSQFFYKLFSKLDGSSQQDQKPKYIMDDLVPYGKIGHEAFKIFLSYIYTGKLKSSPPDVSTCVDIVCAHDACRPAVNFAVELMYASSIFQITELVSLFQRRLFNFVEKVLVEDIIPIVQVAFYCHLDQLLNHCVQRVARSDIDNISLEKELPHDVVTSIKLLRVKSQPDGCSLETMDLKHEKCIRRIYKALDSDDVELVKLLLNESGITLDDANALHYAAAYCDSKVVAEVLELSLANVNLKNARGYTVLHVAAMRREPAVIVSLLTKGACALETTANGENAVTICRRLTRAKDYHKKTEQGQESNKDRICIDILEREMMRNPVAVDESILSPIMADDLHMRLLYLENRVAFARLLFPTEAKLAMKIAQAEMTSEFAGLSASKCTSGNLKEVDLNETPTMRNKRLRSRMDALVKTVELGRRYFPHCSQVLDKFLEDDLPDLFYLERGTPDEQKIKRLRFCELKADVQKAFSKDKAEFSLSGLPSSLKDMRK